MSAHSSEVIQFPAPSTAELAAQNSDRLLRENAVGWVEHFAMYGDEEESEAVYRFLCRAKLKMERERGFGKK